MRSVEIHPGFDPFYYAFYVKGVIELFGRQHVRFTRREFAIPGEQLAFRVFPPELRIYIDGRDRPTSDNQALEWCDVYGKANVDLASLSGDHAQKVVVTGPSFGVQLWPFRTTLRLALQSSWQRRRMPKRRSEREHLANYWRQWRYRLREEMYVPEASAANYVFFLSSLWKREPECNQFRLNFVEACHSIPGIHFEGGFAPRAHDDIRGFERYTQPQHLPLKQYLHKLKRSAVAFNTPTVAGCHGWKLAEFLSLGKAIITTPLLRALPAPLLHGTHVHYVDGSRAAIVAAVTEIVRNESYRRHLEANARAYYEEYLRPARVIERLVASRPDAQRTPRSQTVPAATS